MSVVISLVTMRELLDEAVVVEEGIGWSNFLNLKGLQ